MPPRARKLALTTHVVCSVGWLGAVVAFLALAIAGLTSADPGTVKAVYLAMELMGWFVLVPFAVATLLTGVVQGLGTKWGLFRHYWVVIKLAISLFATFVLLLYTETLALLGAAAAKATSHDVDVLRSPSPLLHAGAALVLLAVATTLAIWKPAGLTPYGLRKHRT